MTGRAAGLKCFSRRAAAVLRRTYFRPSRATACRVDAGAERDRGVLEREPRGDPRGGRGFARASPAGALRHPGADRRSALDGAVANLAETYDARNVVWRRAKFPQASTIEFLLLGEARGAEMALLPSARWRARNTRPDRAALPATASMPPGRSALREMLYDNALLARATSRLQRLRGERSREVAATPGWRCARCAPEAASTRRWTPTPRAWRRFYCDHRRAPEASRRRDAAIAWFGAGERELHRPAPPSRAERPHAASRPRLRRSSESIPSACSQCAKPRAPDARRQAPDQLERPHDHCAGRRRRGARGAHYLDRGGLRGVRPAHCATAGGCCALQRGTPRSTPTRGPRILWRR